MRGFSRKKDLEFRNAYKINGSNFTFVTNIVKNVQLPIAFFQSFRYNVNDIKNKGEFFYEKARCQEKYRMHGMSAV